MATMEINRKTHRALRTFGTLESRMQQATADLNRIEEPAKWEVMNSYLAELSQGLEEVQFLALVSDYLLGIQRERAQLQQENDLLRDELSYVRSKMIRAEEKIVTIEEEQRNSEFSREMARFDAALSGDIDFETAIDDWIVEQDEMHSDEYDEDEAEEISKHNALFDSLFTRTTSVERGDYDSQFGGNETLINNSVCHHNDSEIEHEMTFRTKTAMKYFTKYLNEGRFDIAEPLCHAMIAELQDCNDSSKRDLAVALEILAITDRENHRYSEAADHLKLALNIYEETLDADHPIIVATLNNLAHIYGKCDQYDQAEPLCERALLIRQTRSEYRPRDVARQHNNMAIIHQQQRSFGSAIRHYKKALNIYATQTETTDETIAATDRLKRRMASAMIHLNQYEEAGAVYKDILTPKQKNVKLVLPQKPIWEVAEEVERMSASQRKQSVDSYKLQYDYRDWYDCIQVYLPNAFSSLKKLAFVYRKMNMHNAAKMLEHLVTITDRKKMQLKYAPTRMGLSPQSLAAASRAAHHQARKVDVPSTTTSSSSSCSESTGSFSQNERSI